MWESRVQSLDREDPLERKWQPTPVFLSGESHGQRSLVGYSPWGRKESDMTEHICMLKLKDYVLVSKGVLVNQMTHADS